MGQRVFFFVVKPLEHFYIMRSIHVQADKPIETGPVTPTDTA